jgi:hypothetical protein
VIFMIRFRLWLLSGLLLVTACGHSSSVPPSGFAASSHRPSAVRRALIGRPASPQHRADALRLLPASTRRSPQMLLVDHYICTEWLRWVPDDRQFGSATDPGAGSWQYAYTTCDYSDSFWIDDGSPYGADAKPSITTGSAPNEFDLFTGCKNMGATAKLAEERSSTNNPGFEYGGWIVRDNATNSYYFTVGRLVPLSDNLTGDLPKPPDGTYGPGFSVVGYYHSHPDTNPKNDPASGHFSAADLKLLNDDPTLERAFVIDVWNDTSSGSSQEKRAFFSHDKNKPPSADDDASKDSC